MGKLAGKVALITGAARGQGRSHAEGLAAEGADIIAVDICRQIGTVAYPLGSSEDLAETVRLVEKHDRRAVAFKADVRDLAALRRAVAEGVTELGRLDIVIANAGIMNTVGPAGDEDQAFYDSIDVMLTGVWHTLRATTPVLKDQGQGGSVVITSSTAGFRGIRTNLEAGSAGYVAAKHGVVGLMRVYANILAEHSIRVNTVHPTGVDTAMVSNEAFEAFTKDYPELTQSLRNALPKRLLEPADVTKAILWLVSDDAQYVTGTTLPIDAGFCVRT
ncbi:MAG: mycofactocin-coupled SDR family oxidoreductase [Acidimicrobiales bacterium]|nr:mycofactocin-coupled SDR family oxidoreductase [Acidimicrobiales bacterium]